LKNGVMMMPKRLLLLTLVFMSVVMWSGAAQAEMEMPDGQYFSLVTEDNNIITQTAMQVFPGDIYIAADNSKYVVTATSGNTARCVYQGKEPMPEISDGIQTQANLLDQAIPALNNGQKPTIAVYHTHSDESYVPNDGKESIDGKGGIYDVGAAFVEQLKGMGFNVEYSMENHNPHDVNAYNRSRKTVASLLKTTPAAIIDVHRDAVPPGQYQTQVQGQQATKIKLVVGRTNPNMATNMEFAKNLKAAMDKIEPGLSNGIHVGKGSYNQDLSPRAMLIEVGSDTNDKTAAQKGVTLFAQVLPSVLGVTTGTTGATNAANEPAKKPAAANNQKAWTSILMIIVVIAAVAGGFYLLNKGSISK